MITARDVVLHMVVHAPPRGKQRPRMTRRGRAYTPRATVEFEALIRRHAARAMDGRPPASGPLVLVVDAVFKRPAKPPKGHPSRVSERRHPLAMGGAHYPDADNVLKAISDALNGIAYIDDAQLWDVRCRRWWGEEAEASCIEVVVYCAP